MSTKIDENVMQAWIELHRANRLLLDNVEAELKKYKLPPLDWYDVLLELNRDPVQGLRQYEIGEKVLLSKHNLSRLLDRLENNGLLGRYACEEDGRGNRIIITDEGKKTLKAMWPVYRNVMQSNFGDKLTNNELQQVVKILSKVRN